VSRTKKTMIVDIVFVNSVMGAEWWKRGEKGESQGVGPLLPDWGPGWMGIRHHEQEAGPPSKWGSFIICKGFNDRLLVHSVNINICMSFKYK
jgi:hypothetical protein